MPPLKRKHAASDTEDDDESWLPSSLRKSSNVKKQVTTSKHSPEIKAHCLRLLEQYEQDPDNNGTGLQAVNIILQLPQHDKKDKDRSLSAASSITTILEDSLMKMNTAVYGHPDAKLEILQYHTSRLLGKGKGGSRVLGLVGPPGVGKTSLVVNGVSNALNLPFFQMSIGGMRDVTYFTGSLPCWKGSHQSVFADILISHGHEAIVYIDEIDKVASETALDIYGWLTHAVDPLANHKIRDSFLGMDLDLSGLTFIFSYNEADMLPEPLRDRIKEVHLCRFTTQEKIAIVRQFIIPESLARYSLTPTDIVFADEIVSEINIRDTGEGVRQLKKMYESIIDRIMLRIACTKEGLNHYRSRLKMPIPKEASASSSSSTNFFDIKPIKTALPYNVDITDL